MNRNNTTSKREELIQTFHLPQDICLGSLHIRIIGNCEVWIENYKCIKEYDPTHLLLQGCREKVCFEGKNLRIDCFTSENLKVTGQIVALRFID